MWASFVSVLSGLFKLSNQLVAWARQRQMVSLGEDRANKAHAEKSLDNIKKAIRSRADIRTARDADNKLRSEGDFRTGED